MMSVTLLVNTKEYLIIFSRLPSVSPRSFEKLKPRLPQSFVIPFRSEVYQFQAAFLPTLVCFVFAVFSKWRNLVDQTTQDVFQEICPRIHLVYERAMPRLSWGNFYC